MRPQNSIYGFLYGIILHNVMSFFLLSEMLKKVMNYSILNYNYSTVEIFEYSLP